jgi:hypothetical protein
MWGYFDKIVFLQIGGSCNHPGSRERSGVLSRDAGFFVLIGSLPKKRISLKTLHCSWKTGTNGEINGDKTYLGDFHP